MDYIHVNIMTGVEVVCLYFFNIKICVPDDCLKFIKFVSSDIFQLKPVRIVLTLTFSLNAIFQLLTVYFALFVIEPHHFFSYVPSFLGQFYVRYFLLFTNNI